MPLPFAFLWSLRYSHHGNIWNLFLKDKFDFIMIYIGIQTAESHIAAKRSVFCRKLSKYVCSMALILAACLLSNGCALYRWSELAPSVTGRVLETSGKGIAGACITYKTNYAPYVKTAVTDEDGCFELGSITSGNFYIILPFFGMNIPFAEYHVEKKESPACYIEVEKSGYSFFSTLLKSEYIDRDRQLTLYHRTRPVKEMKLLPYENTLFDNMYRNVSLPFKNNVTIYLHRIK